LKKETSDEMSKLKNKDVKKNGGKTAYIDRANYLLEKYRAALFFLFVQGLVILYLLFGFLSIKQNTIVEVMLPKIVKDTDYGKLKIGIDTSNDLYYKIFGSYIVEMVMNARKSNIDGKVEVLKKLLFPEVLGEYGKRINSYADFIKKNNADVRYTEYEHSVSTNENKETTYVSKGLLKIKLGRYPEKKSICETKVKMITKNYMLFVTSFVRKCESSMDEEKMKHVK